MTSNILSMCMCMHGSWQRCHGVLLVPSTTCNQSMQHNAPYSLHCMCAAQCRCCKSTECRQADNSAEAVRCSNKHHSLCTHSRAASGQPRNMHNKQHYSPSSRAREGAHRCTRAARQHALLKRSQVSDAANRYNPRETMMFCKMSPMCNRSSKYTMTALSNQAAARVLQHAGQTSNAPARQPTNMAATPTSTQTCITIKYVPAYVIQKQPLCQGPIVHQAKPALLPATFRCIRRSACSCQRAAAHANALLRSHMTCTKTSCRTANTRCTAASGPQPPTNLSTPPQLAAIGPFATPGIRPGPPRPGPPNPPLGGPPRDTP